MVGFSRTSLILTNRTQEFAVIRDVAKICNPFLEIDPVEQRNTFARPLNYAIEFLKTYRDVDKKMR